MHSDNYLPRVTVPCSHIEDISEKTSRYFQETLFSVYCMMGIIHWCKRFTIFSVSFQVNILQYQIFILHINLSKQSHTVKLLHYKLAQIMKIVKFYITNTIQYTVLPC